MKLQLPYSKKEFQRLQIIHRLEVDRFNRILPEDHTKKKAQAEVVLNIVDQLYNNINNDYYNKYSKNVCRFGHFEDTKEVCEKKFKNTLANYVSNGNCCKSCNSVILNRMKNICTELI